MNQPKRKGNQRLKVFARKWGLPAVAVIAAFTMGYLVHGGPAGEPEDRSKVLEGTPAETAGKEKKTTWTCSMHPQIKMPKPGLCPICNMELIPLEEDETEAGGLRELAVSESAKKLMEIQTTPVERKFVETEIRMVGKIDYDETRFKYISSWVPGRLDKLYVDYTGIPVRKGDRMVHLYSPELLSAQEELLQALGTVEALSESSSAVMRDTARATVAAVREKLRLWGLTHEQIGEIEKLGAPTDHITIYSPIGGVVIHKNAQEGMYVDTGTRIYTVADLSQVWVQLDAYESDLMWLRIGQKVEFTTESYPGEAFMGTIAFIDPVLTQTTRTVKIRVNAPNPDMKLKPGMFVRAVAGAGIAAADEPLVIPATAALVTGKRAIVYVQLPDKDKPTFEGREIVLGPRAGEYYLVRHGLEEGELVVTRGSFKIDAELQLRAKPSMMTPEGGGGESEHRHGDAESTSKRGGGSAAELPALFRARLHAVVAAAGKVGEAVAVGDLAEARSAFATLEEKVGEVRRESLTGHTAMLWKEYSMLLANDGVEGKYVESLSEAERVAEVMKQHLASMSSGFGLSISREKKADPAVDIRFRRQFARVVRGYLGVQETLAADSAVNAAAAAKKALEALRGVDMSLLKGDDHMAWMKLSAEIEESLSQAAGAGDIEAIRTTFAPLSENMMSAAKRFGPPLGGTLYQVKCSMAFDNQGATWLQPDEQIRNPYFGSMMLQCGEVVEVIAGEEDTGGAGNE